MSRSPSAKTLERKRRVCEARSCLAHDRSLVPLGGLRPLRSREPEQREDEKGSVFRMSGSLKIERFERQVTTHTARGTSTEPHVFLKLVVEGASGSIAIEIDAGDWSRMLANPSNRAPVTLTAVAKPVTGSAA